MSVRNRDIGACSWSLKETDADAVIGALRSVGLSHLQLALRPFTSAAEATRAARRYTEADVTLTAGMIGFAGEDYTTIDTIRQTGGLVPDAWADERVARTIEAGRLGNDVFGISSISTHAGFLPEPGSSNYSTVQRRLGTIADAYAQDGVRLLFETGQETAAHLARFLDDLDRPNVLANFDPANMILYGAGDPVAAVRTLGRRIGHVHVKDALPSDRPGLAWGREVPVGQGAVDWGAFLDALDDVGYGGPLVIEREAGPTRVADIRAAVETLERVA